MTELLDRPATRTPAPAPRRSIAATGALAAGLAAGGGVTGIAVLVLAAWAAGSGGSSAGEAIRTVVQVWLAAHHTGFVLTGGLLLFSPLGLTVLPLVAISSASGWAANACHVDDVRSVTRLVAAVSLTYAVLVGATAALVSSPAVRPIPPSAVLGAVVVAVLAAGTGAVRAAGLTGDLWSALPRAGRSVLASGTVALGVLLAGGALVSGGALLRHLGRATDLTDALHAGPVGGVLLGLLGLAAVPNACIWGATVTLGPGFAVGTGTSVTVAGSHLGAVPAFPLLAALPSDGRLPWWTAAICVVPVLAGVTAGFVLLRREPAAALGTLAGRALGAGALAGVAFAVLAVLSGGSVGGGRLAAVGPAALTNGLAAALELGLVAAGTVTVVSLWRTSGRDDVEPPRDHADAAAPSEDTAAVPGVDA